MIICQRCGHPLEDHSVGHDAIPADEVPRYTEARFDGIEMRGVYCPHLDDED